MFGSIVMPSLLLLSDNGLNIPTLASSAPVEITSIYKPVFFKRSSRIKTENTV